MLESIQVPGLAVAEENALQALLQQWRAKLPRNLLRTDFYEMKNSTTALMSSAAPDWVKSRAFVLGWSSIAVDKLNRRCNLDGFYSPDGADLSSAGLDELVDENRLVGELSQAGVSSLTHAVSFLVATPGDPKSGEPKALLMAKDALSATGIWDPRRKALRSFLSVARVSTWGSPTEMTMYLPGVYIVMRKADTGWIAERRTHNYGLPVWPMRYKPRLGRPFGASRISRAVMSIHQQALSAMLRADVNGEAYSLPRYAFLGLSESAFQNPDGTPKPALTAIWDAAWFIGDDEDLADQGSQMARADVKQFHGQSPEPQNGHLRMLAQMFSGETGIPIGELGIIGDSNPTSEGALSASREDITAEAESTTDTWSPDVSSAVMAALAMRNGEPVPKVLPQWRDPRHTSRAAAADAGLKTIQAMPWLGETEVGMEMLGMSQSQIQRAMAQRSRAEARASIAALRAASGI